MRQIPTPNPSNAYAMNTSVTLDARYNMIQAIKKGTFTINIARFRPSVSVWMFFGENDQKLLQNSRTTSPAMNPDITQPIGCNKYPIPPNFGIGTNYEVF